MKTDNLFEDIQIGDVVYLRHEVYHSYYVRDKFFLPHTVDRVTSKQFKIGNVHYRKSDGKAVGHTYSAYKLGEKVGAYSIVKDQTAEYEASKELYEVNRNIISMISNLDKWTMKSVHSLGLDKSKQIRELLERIEDIEASDED